MKIKGNVSWKNPFKLRLKYVTVKITKKNTEIKSRTENIYEKETLL